MPADELLQTLFEIEMMLLEDMPFDKEWKKAHAISTVAEFYCDQVRKRLDELVA